MITVDNAAKLVLKVHPNVEIQSAYNYRGNYLFVAPDKKLGLYNDYNDPFYVVNKKTGIVSAITPLEDFEGFDEAFRSEPLSLKRKER